MEESQKQQLISYLVEYNMEFSRMDSRLTSIFASCKADVLIDSISEARLIISQLKDTKVGKALF